MRVNTFRKIAMAIALTGLAVCLGTSKGTGPPSSGPVAAHGSIDAAFANDDIYDHGINGGAAPDCSNAPPAATPSPVDNDPMQTYNVRFHDGTVVPGLQITYYAPSGQQGQLQIYGDSSVDTSPYYGPIIRTAFTAWQNALVKMVPPNHYLRLTPTYETNNPSVPVTMTYTDGAPPTPNEGGQTMLGLDTKLGFLSGTRITFYSMGPIIQDAYYTTELHELGHALGLQHSQHPNDVMYYAFYDSAPCYTVNGWSTPAPYAAHPVALLYDPVLNCDEDGSCAAGVPAAVTAESTKIVPSLRTARPSCKGRPWISSGARNSPRTAA